MSGRVALEDGFGLYLVLTDPVAGYRRCAEAAVEAGVRIVQLRMKHAPAEEVLRTAEELRAITRGTRTLFVVNDEPAIAAAAEADGVHVGQSDMAVAEVRRRFPSLGLVGLSTHNLPQVASARESRPDYIGVGPVHATPTKEIPDPTLGVATMAEMVVAAPCPAVAIGGLDETNLAEAVAAGARNWAVVRAVCRAADPLAAIRRLQDVAWQAIKSTTFQVYPSHQAARLYYCSKHI